jgi:hypothetical protein
MARRWNCFENQSASFHIFEFEFTNAFAESGNATSRYLVVDDDDDILEYVHESLNTVCGNLLLL